MTYEIILIGFTEYLGVGLYNLYFVIREWADICSMVLLRSFTQPFSCAKEEVNPAGKGGHEGI